VPASQIVVDVLIDHHLDSPLNSQEIGEIVKAAASDQGFYQGQIGVRITTDSEIHQINRQHLQHDYPTDVISFDYRSEDYQTENQSEKRIEGELVVSVETADQQASEVGWSCKNELALYLVHGTLHVCGMDDQEPEARLEMRRAEQRVLKRVGIHLPENVSPDGGFR
jgi:probable rRNA maturation factor